MATLEPEVTEILLTKWLELKISGEEKNKKDTEYRWEIFKWNENKK